MARSCKSKQREASADNNQPVRIATMAQGNQRCGFIIDTEVSKHSTNDLKFLKSIEQDDLGIIRLADDTSVTTQTQESS